jgi:hypothetical protein
VLDVGVDTARLSQPKVVTGQHYSGAARIMRSCIRSMNGVAPDSLEPPDQLPRRTSRSARASHRVERRKMQAAGADPSRRRLGVNLNELVVSGQRAGSGGYRVLRSGGNTRLAPLGLRSRGSRKACHSQRHACQPWIQGHVPTSNKFESGPGLRPAKAEPNRTYVHCIAGARSSWPRAGNGGSL